MAEDEIRHAITIAAPIDAVRAQITKVGTRQPQLDDPPTTFRHTQMPMPKAKPV